MLRACGDTKDSAALHILTICMYDVYIHTNTYIYIYYLYVYIYIYYLYVYIYMYIYVYIYTQCVDIYIYIISSFRRIGNMSALRRRTKPARYGSNIAPEMAWPRRAKGALLGEADPGWFDSSGGFHGDFNGFPGDWDDLKGFHGIIHDESPCFYSDDHRRMN